MEQTNPQAGVSQEADVLQRMTNFISQSEQDQAPDEERRAAQPEPETPEAQSSEPQGQTEPTVEDLPEEPQPTTDFALEIVHDGQQQKLSREDAIRYAQQGLDYTKKTQAVAERDRQVAEQLQRLAQIEQVQPFLAQAAAEVSAIEAQLKQYQNVNWVQLATEDPIGYPQQHAKFQALQQAYGQAAQKYQYQRGMVMQELGKVAQQRLQTEEARMPGLIPEWKDAGKREAIKQQVVKYLQDKGATPQDLNAMNSGTALHIANAYKAMKYDQLLQAKQDKSKQLRTAPPVARPGVARTPDAARADKDKELSTKLRKSGSLEDAAALLLNRGLIK